MWKNNKFHIEYLAIFLIILSIFTFPIIFKMNNAVYGPLYGTDNRAAIWHFWWFNYSFENNLNVDTNILTNYPFGVANMAPKIFPLCMIPAYILSILVNEIFAYNVLILSSFIFSFLCMYILVFYLTKRRSAAFISGLIYSLCPYHINKSWEHFGLTFIEFIPLYVYCLLKLKEKPSLKHLIFCVLSLILVILSDQTYVFIILIFSLFYLFFLVFSYWKNKVNLYLHLLNFMKMSILSFLIVLPILYPSLKKIFLSRSNLAFGDSNVLIRPFHYLFTQSASILAYLIPSKFHPIWGGLARSLEGSIFFGRGSIEQTLYLGWIGLFLTYIAIKKKNQKDISKINQITLTQKEFTQRLFLFILFASIIFSMPPYLNLLFFKVYFPSFLIYKIFPVFRAYARFGVLAILSVSILAGYGFSSLLITKKRRLITTALVSFLILIDFANIPPFRIAEINRCPAVYSWLAEQRGFFAIAEYPIRLGDMSEGYENLDYLLYQRFHQKAIINGAKPGTYAYTIKQKIIKITEEETPEFLSSLGVKYVILHLDEYRQGNNKEATDIIGEIPDLSKSKGLKLVKKLGDDEVYEITASSINN
ncbi:hypothetical protein ACFL2Y_03065 [Candidatus Omnitrophota bacterium]